MSSLENKEHIICSTFSGTGLRLIQNCMYCRFHVRENLLYTKRCASHFPNIILFQLHKDHLVFMGAVGSAEFLKKENEVLIAENIAQGHIAGGFQSHDLNRRLIEAKTQSTKKIVDI